MHYDKLSKKLRDRYGRIVVWKKNEFSYTERIQAENSLILLFSATIFFSSNFVLFFGCWMCLTLKASFDNETMFGRDFDTHTHSNEKKTPWIP